ncbi:MAG: VTT domain-containing protein [Acidobacteriia bacterium]|nr:VTT domain-containing protein [Terriglobia bacterium]
METATRHLLQHGYFAIFVVALSERLGLPMLVTPFLLAAGALAGSGLMSLALVVLVASIPAVAADAGWYWLGRKKGLSVIRLICRMSLERDSCVRRTQSFTSRHAGRSLIYSKFLPGVGHLAPPMAGLAEMGFGRFLFWETLGTLIFTLSLVLIGYMASAGLRWPGIRWTDLGALALNYIPVLLVLLVVGNVVWKYVQRERFIRSLRADRISPDDLAAELDSGDLVIIDLRHQLDVLHDPRSIPGALHIYPEELKERFHEIPAHKDIVLYCT